MVTPSATDRRRQGRDQRALGTPHRSRSDIAVTTQGDGPIGRRANPFDGIWEAEIVPLVRSMPSLQAITILRELPASASRALSR